MHTIDGLTFGIDAIVACLARHLRNQAMVHSGRGPPGRRMAAIAFEVVARYVRCRLAGCA